MVWAPPYFLREIWKPIGVLIGSACRLRHMGIPTLEHVPRGLV